MDSNDPDFAICDAMTLTDDSFVAIRPNWNCDGRSIIFEIKRQDSSELHRISADGSNQTALKICNDGARRVQGRAAFFAQDDFAFVSDRSGRSAIWRCHLESQTLRQLTFPTGEASDHGPSAANNQNRYLFFRSEDTSGVSHVYLSSIDGAALTRLTRWAINPGSLMGSGNSSSIRIAAGGALSFVNRRSPHRSANVSDLRIRRVRTSRPCAPQLFGADANQSIARLVRHQCDMIERCCGS
jgi:Tol biopolymer transport system component